MKKFLLPILIFILLVLGSCDPDKPGNDYPIIPIDFKHVNLTDNVWRQWLDINSKVTIPYGFKMCEKTGRVDNFAIAGGLKQGEFCSKYPFDDSDVYKIIEGASYSLSVHYSIKLDQYLDSLIILIGAAQEEDGYIQTWRTINPNKPGGDWWGTSERWTKLESGHELYNLGHLYEAAVAHYKATSKRSLFDIAVKSANLVNKTFGPGKKIGIPGHEEIEIGLIKLYQVTGEKRFIDLARFFIDKRGVATERELWGEYNQDHMPVREQREARGHAVRAGYLYSAMADITAFSGDTSYQQSLKSIWEDVVNKKMYITGGVGAQRSGEAFGEPYELPNFNAYAETCASIAMVLWNHRMFRLYGDAKYYDVLEKVLYNGFISGISKTGDRFFYPNPLESDGKTVFNYGSATRQPWFDCACCPSNIARFLPQVPSMIYATASDKVYVNLFISNEAVLSVNNRNLKIQMKTEYPWSGSIQIKIQPVKPSEFTLAIRIPGWAKGEASPGSLYAFINPPEDNIVITVNGKEVIPQYENGYAMIKKKWKTEEEILIMLSVRPIIIESHKNVKENSGKLAIQYGPVIYCAEEADNPDNFNSIRLDESTNFSVRIGEGILENDLVIISQSQIDSLQNGTFIPYYAWSNRGSNAMKVWFSKSN